MESFWDKWAKLSIPIKFLMLLGIWAVMAGIHYLLIYSDQVQTLGGLARQLRTFERKRYEHEVIARNLPRWQAEVERLRGEMDKALTLLPNQREIPALLQKITGLGEKSGLEILRFQPRKEVPEGFYARVPVAVKVRGSFHEIMVFFDKVGKLDRIVNIHNIKLSNPKRKNERIRLSASCVATTFRFLPRGASKKKRRGRRRKRRKHRRR